MSTSLAGLLAMQGAFEDARRVYADAVAIYEEVGLRLRRAAYAHVGAQVELLAGDPAAAEKELRISTDALGTFGARSFAATHRALLADVLCTLDRLEEAEALAREVAEATPEDDLGTQALWRSTLGRVLVRSGRVAEAEGLASESIELTAGMDFPDLRVAALTGAAEVEAARGRPDEARRLLEEARRIMEAKGNIAALTRLDAALAEPVR